MRLSSSAPYLGVAAILVISLSLPGQSTPPAQAAPASAADSTGMQPTLRTSTNLVLVDVVATDHDQPVLGLDHKSFHIFEDGKELPISSIDDHKPTGPVAPPPFITMPLPANTYTNLPAYPPSSAVNVLLLDALNTQVTDQMLMRRKMLDYLESVKPGTTLAIFTLSTQLRMITPFTNDAAALARAAKNPKTNPQATAMRNTPQMDQANSQEAGLTGGMGDIGDPIRGYAPPLSHGTGEVNLTQTTVAADMSGVDSLRLFEADQGVAQIDARIRITLDAMQQLAHYLGGIDGRKNVIWFSGAFPIVIFPDPTLGLHAYDNVTSYRDQIQKAGDMLTAARVALYPIDAEGLEVHSAFSASQKFVAPNEAFATQQLNERADWSNIQTSMKVMADETGGKAYVETNDLDKAVADAAENGSIYYTIAYVPPGNHDDGKYHKIQVRVDGNPAFKLAYRRGYYADTTGMPPAPESDPSTLFASALAHDAPAATQVLFRARVLPASDPQLQGAGSGAGPAGQMTLKGTPHRYVVDLTLDPHGLTFNPGSDGSHHATVELAMAAYDADGNTVNFYQHSFQVGLKDAQLEKVMSSGIGLRLPFDLPAGNIALRIGVHDLNANRAGSLEVPLQVSAP